MKKPQSLSLQEQLLKSGLTTDAKAKQVKTEKRKQQKQQRTQGVETVDEIKLDIEQQRLQQIERDKLLNQQRKQAEEQKALLAQVRQLVEQHCVAEDADGAAYQFSDANKVKSIYVNENTRHAIIEGRLGIVKLDDAYYLVNADAANKIRERDASSVLVLNNAHKTETTDDPYAAYAIPDDLIW